MLLALSLLYYVHVARCFNIYSLKLNGICLLFIAYLHIPLLLVTIPTTIYFVVTCNKLQNIAISGEANYLLPTSAQVIADTFSIFTSPSVLWISIPVVRN